MATTDGYSLNLNDNKRNIFVTQLNDRDDDEDVQAFPVVKETGGQLLETGLNTLQKTLLLKKQVEVEQVENDLYNKRMEFKEKMQQCAEKQIEIQKRQQQMKDEFANCEKYIKDYEAKRRRAIQKYQTEMKLKEQKTKEYEMLCDQLALLKARQKHLDKKVSRYRKFEEFLLKVIDIMPEDYIAPTDDKVKGLMMRHRTLSESSKALIDKLEYAGDEMKQHRMELDEMKSEHDKMKLSINSRLAQLQNESEKMQEKNKQMEQNFAASKGKMRAKRTEFGITMMAIDNITDKCLKPMEPAVETLNLEQKLKKIGDYLIERIDVARMAGGPSTESAKDRDSARPAESVGKSRAAKKTTPKLKLS